MSNRRQSNQSMRGITATGALGLPLVAQAQSTPDLARILVGFPPGGTTDALSRLVATYPQTALNTKDVIDSLASVGVEAQSSTPDQLADWLKADANTWRGIVQQIGFKADS